MVEAFTREHLLELLRTAHHALRSYQYGNTARDLARDVADAIEPTLEPGR